MMQWTPVTFGAMVALIGLALVANHYMDDSTEVEER